MQIIRRDIHDQVLNTLDNGKIAIIYGARQVGKTTLSREIAKQISDNNYLYLNCEEPDVDVALTNKTSTELKSYIGQYKTVVFDEAQKITNIGNTLKLVHDKYPDIKLLATGSSSFQLANIVNEPLTGRSVYFELFPFSLNELSQKYNEVELSRLLDEILVYGSYPGIILSSGAEAETTLINISRNYLYKDLLDYGEIRSSDLVQNLLQALALQVGSEVSLNELAKLLEVDKKTVKRYIELLEKAFVIYRLKPLTRNKRKEVGKFKKVFFYDLGIRNSLLRNFNEVRLRDDVGGLWENFCINERLKYNQANSFYPNYYFWRNIYGAEVDFVEEWQGSLNAFEFKWSKHRKSLPKAFREDYEQHTYSAVTKDNFLKLWQNVRQITN